MHTTNKPCFKRFKDVMGFLFISFMKPLPLTKSVTALIMMWTDDFVLLGYDTASLGYWFLLSREHNLMKHLEVQEEPLKPWGRKHYVHLKCQELITQSSTIQLWKPHDSSWNILILMHIKSYHPQPASCAKLLQKFCSHFSLQMEVHQI